VDDKTIDRVEAGSARRLLDECDALIEDARRQAARGQAERRQQIGDLQRRLDEAERRAAALATQLAGREQELAHAAARAEASERERARLAAEVERLRADLSRIHGSRWWRVGSLYWALMRRAGRLRRRVAGLLQGRAAGTASDSGTPAPPEPTPPTPPLRAHREDVVAAPATGARFDVVCFPVIDWGFRFQRPQQIARQLGARGHRVFYVALQFRTEGPPYVLREVAPNVWEVRLRATPANVYQDQLTPEAVGEVLGSLNALRRDFALGATASIVQLPFWWPVAKRAWEELSWPVVYDCMDDHAGFSTNRPQMLVQEEELLRGARLVCVSSEKLRERASLTNASCVLVRNGCDFEHFCAVSPPPRGPRPVIGYYGAIAEWFDADLVADLAERRPDWDFLLVGSTFTADTARLSRLPNVTLAGERPYAELPSWLDRMDVLVIPFKRVPLTEATNPVKAYEILAAGRPLVSVPLPEVEAMRPHVRLASTPSEFESEILAALAADGPTEAARRRAFAAQHTWEERVDRLVPALRSAFPLVSIVVVTFNNLALNRQCLESVYERTDWPNFEVLVVDNASSDGTPEYLAEALAEHPTLRVVLNDTNEGFARANNIALARARGDVLVLLNNDTVVSRGWLSTLVRHLRRDPGLGMVGPVSNAVGNEARIPVGYRDVADMPAWAAEHVRRHDGETFEIPMLGMFCVAVRRDVYEKVGPLDERFEIGMFEDDDYAHRVRAAGYSLRCARDAFVHHWQKASFDLIGGPARYFGLYQRNRRRFEEKWGREVDREAGPPPPAGLEPVLRAAAACGGDVAVFPAAGPWRADGSGRAQALARALARAGDVVVFDLGPSESGARTREIEPRLFLREGPPEDLLALDDPVLWVTSEAAGSLAALAPSCRVVWDGSGPAQHGDGGDAPPGVILTCASRADHARALSRHPGALFVPDSVDHELFSAPGPLPEDLRQRLGAESVPVAACLALPLAPLDAMRLQEIAARRPDWRFAVVGGLPPRPGRGMLLRRANVTWLGQVRRGTLPALLASVDAVAIVVQSGDALPCAALLPALAAGRPVVSTVPPEEALAGVWVAEDADAFSRALDAARREIADPALAARMRAGARERSWAASLAPVLRRLDSLRPREAATPVPAELPREGLAEETGRCNVCGRSTRFLRWNDEPCRESLVCACCRTTSRYRSIARGLLDALALLSGRESPASLRELRGHRLGRAVAVYDTQVPFRTPRCAYPLPDLLARCPDVEVLVSSLREDLPPGEPLGPRATNQNLERLTFEDASLDIVVTSDVMEHVRLDDLAHREIRRVLRPGGVYLFTVPHVRGGETITKVRVPDPAKPARDEVVGEPEYHGDTNSPEGRALAYRVYGIDLDRRLEALGFEVAYSRVDHPGAGIRDTELFFCRLRS
jgi:GT2 family glycosyltransferase/glycosyltransferase involved in cell wall biosynthesis/SAM-dependent methyltransferase